jgi:hypothetical protein
MLTPPKKLSASELSGVETWQGVLKEAIEYLKDLGDEIRNLSEATKDIWEIHRNRRQGAVALLVIAGTEECRPYTSFCLRYNYSW